MAEAKRECSRCNGGVMVLSQENESGSEYRCLHCDNFESEPAEEKESKSSGKSSGSGSDK